MSPTLKIGLLAIVVFAIGALSLVAQEDYIIQSRFLGEADGLSNRSVRTILPDQRGFLWIGTDKGLNRYDGYRFQVFNTENSGMPHDRIFHLYEDPEGWLWIFSMEGFQPPFFFHTITHEVKTFSERFPGKLPLVPADLKEPVFTADGAVWIGMRNKAGVARFNQSSGWEHFSHHRDSVELICPADSTTVLCRIGDALHVLDSNGKFTTKQRLLSNAVLGEPGVTFTPYRNGIVRLPGHNAFTSFDARSLLPPANAVSLIQRSAEDNIFVLTPSLYMDKWTLWDRKGTQLIDFASFFADGASVIPIVDNKIWVAGYNGLLMLDIRPRYFTHFLGQEDLGNRMNRSCRGIWTDGQVIYAHLDEHGLYAFDIETRKAKLIFSNSTWGYFGLIHENGALYGGTANGIYRYQLHTGQTKFWNTADYILNLRRLPDGRMLLGTNKGLWILDEMNDAILPFTGYGSFNELSQHPVGNIGVSPDGQWWISSTEGFYALDPQRGITARYWNGGSGEYYLPAKHFQHFCVDNEGLFWLATADNGLIIWDKANQSVRKINRADGLSSDHAYAVHQDAHQQFWVSTDEGLNQIDKASMHLRFWNARDGIGNYEFNVSSHFQDQHGVIYMGGLDGITRFQPNDFDPVHDEDPEPFFLGSIQVFNSRTGAWHEPLAAANTTQPLTLSRGDNLMRIEFAMLDLDQPQDIRYSWRLHGLDTVWKSVSFPELQLSRPPYGKYELQIRAIPSQGIWRGKEIQLPIIVIPPVYLRPWFWITVVLGLIVAFFQYGRWKARTQLRQAHLLREEVMRQTATIRQQTEALKKLDEMKTRFFANVSHELRTPLTLLLGPIGSLLKRKSFKPEEQSLLQSAHANAQHLVGLVNEILDLGKLESGTMSKDMRPLSIARLFGRLCAAFESHAAQLGIHYSVAIDIPEDGIVFMDEKKFTIIINNLLSNAFKFTPAGGHVAASIQANGDSFYITVEDNGPGIAKDDLPHIFDRYYQSKSADAPMAGGTGIGLALCKEFVQFLGGDIAVAQASNGKTGTTFNIRLPIEQVDSVSVDSIAMHDESLPGEILASTAVSIEKNITGSTSRPCILIVEDHPGLRQYIAGVLSTQYEVCLATHGQEALDVLEKMQSSQLPALILSDIMMPIMDGFQLADAVKRHDRYGAIPMIVLTARAAFSDKLRALRIGVDDYLLKPFEEDELLIRIHNLLRHVQGRQVPDPEIADEPMDEPGGVAFNMEDQQWLRDFEELVVKKIPNFNLNVDVLAGEMSMSRTTLFRRVKQLTGLTAQQYVAEVRFRVALDLLETRRYSTVKSVAHTVGFRDVEHFSRQFRERFGRLPSSYLN